MQSTVAIVGCGALGSFQAGAMARAGVGKLILIDRDYLEPSNLQRQWLYDETDVLQGLPKAPAAESHVREINSCVSSGCSRRGSHARAISMTFCMGATSFWMAATTSKHVT